MSTTMPKLQPETSVELPFRHTLATLGYRAAKPLRDVPEGFSEFSPGKGAVGRRTPCASLRSARLGAFSRPRQRGLARYEAEVLE